MQAGTALKSTALHSLFALQQLPSSVCSSHPQQNTVDLHEAFKKQYKRLKKKPKLAQKTPKHKKTKSTKNLSRPVFIFYLYFSYKLMIQKHH